MARGNVAFYRAAGRPVSQQMICSPPLCHTQASMLAADARARKATWHWRRAYKRVRMNVQYHNTISAKKAAAHLKGNWDPAARSQVCDMASLVC